MRCVVQRVLSASVEAHERSARCIENGLCVLVGISHFDTLEDIRWMVNKLLHLKIFSSSYKKEDNESLNTEKNWSHSLKEIHGGLLLISQFTLYHQTKGTRLDFHKACTHAKAKEIFSQLVYECEKAYDTKQIQRGFFGEHMKIQMANDGPVTLVLESPFSTRTEEQSKTK